ncbi:MAG: glycoside hydrolase family 5 protein [Lachnospiraceae bacterium]|nr:glycoside hydrolase family 5 protein [Lachnospiraceae bacterium]
MKYYLLFLILIFFILFLTFQHRSKSEAAIFAKALQPGWNLGNTLDSHGLANPASPRDTETYWGNPYTTREMIHAIKEKGFHTIRIPVTWEGHMDADNVVNPAWMNRVQEVVDYAIDEDLYVIINAHHDNWYQPDEAHYQDGIAKMSALWSQIAEHFSKYEDYLLFESMNEPRLTGTSEEWTGGTAAAQKIVNEYNQVFLNTIRSSDAVNNKTRYLLIPSYCASTDRSAMEALDIPEDSHVIVSLHMYDPYEFALKPDGTSEWNSDDPHNTHEIDAIFKDIHRIFTKKGVAVMLTEFGAMDKDNETARADWTAYMMQKAKKENITCIWWDDSIFDRSTLTWHYPSITGQLCPSSDK